MRRFGSLRRRKRDAFRCSAPRVTPARQPSVEQGGHHVERSRIAGAAGVVRGALGLIAAFARQGQIARIIGVVANACGQRSGLAFAEPGLRHDVFERRCAERLAIGAQFEVRAAMQAARAPDPANACGLNVTGDGKPQQSP